MADLQGITNTSYDYGYWAIPLADLSDVASFVSKNRHLASSRSRSRVDGAATIQHLGPELIVYCGRLFFALGHETSSVAARQRFGAGYHGFD
jgi:hypothetical protein